MDDTQTRTIIIFLLQLHLAFRPSHFHCLFVLFVPSVHHMTHCIPPCCMAWQRCVHCVRLKWGHLNWCWVFQYGIVDHGFWPNGMRKHFNIKPHSGSHLKLIDLCIDTVSDIVLTVGQFGEPISGSSKIHINQSINQSLYRLICISIYRCSQGSSWLVWPLYPPGQWLITEHHNGPDQMVMRKNYMRAMKDWGLTMSIAVLPLTYMSKIHICTHYVSGPVHTIVRILKCPSLTCFALTRSEVHTGKIVKRGVMSLVFLKHQYGPTLL